MSTHAPGRAGLPLAGRPAALLLDMDGTLVDSEPIHREGYRRFFTARGWPADDETISQFTGRRADDVFASTPGPWSGEDPLALFDEVVSHMATDRLPEVVAGTVELLDAARDAGVRLALVTSADRGWASAALAEVGGLDAFEVCVTREDVTRGKPDPQPFTLAVERLGVAAGDCLACEDSPDGIRSALAAGVGTVVGMTTTWPATRLTTSGAHLTAADHHGLAAALA